MRIKHPNCIQPTDVIVGLVANDSRYNLMYKGKNNG
jgi:hypothetical protein